MDKNLSYFKETGLHSWIQHSPQVFAHFSFAQFLLHFPWFFHFLHFLVGFKFLQENSVPTSGSRHSHAIYQTEFLCKFVKFLCKLNRTCTIVCVNIGTTAISTIKIAIQIVCAVITIANPNPHAGIKSTVTETRGRCWCCSCCGCCFFGCIVFIKAFTFCIL